jgi:hypothetical protein
LTSTIFGTTRVIDEYYFWYNHPYPHAPSSLRWEEEKENEKRRRISLSLFYFVPTHSLSPLSISFFSLRVYTPMLPLLSDGKKKKKMRREEEEEEELVFPSFILSPHTLSLSSHNLLLLSACPYPHAPSSLRWEEPILILSSLNLPLPEEEEE